MPIFKDPDAVTSMIDMMVAYVEVLFPDVEVIAGIWFCIRTYLHKFIQ